MRIMNGEFQDQRVRRLVNWHAMKPEMADRFVLDALQRHGPMSGTALGFPDKEICKRLLASGLVTHKMQTFALTPKGERWIEENPA